MKYDISKTLVNLDGTDAKDETGTILTFKPILVNSAMFEAPQEQGQAAKRLSGTEQIKRYSLGKKLFKATDSVDITAEEVTLLKENVALLYPIGITAQTLDFLEGKNVVSVNRTKTN